MADQVSVEQQAGLLQRPETTRTRPVVTPPADIYETPDGLVVLVDMPGVAADGIDVSLEKHVLTINGRRAKATSEGLALVQAEYRDADFQRAFTLSEAIDGERIEASIKDGVLALTLPKASPIPAKAITVRAG
mgnify:CR=1 FL=1